MVYVIISPSAPFSEYVSLFSEYVGLPSISMFACVQHTATYYETLQHAATTTSHYATQHNSDHSTGEAKKTKPPFSNHEIPWLYP